MQAATQSHGAVGYVQRAVTSSLGAKLLMGATGLLFYGWLILHMLGNLTIFGGQELVNKYAHFLKGTPELLWAQRIGLIVVAGLHIVGGLRLAALNRAARPTPYASPRKWRQASLASRTMAVSGVIVLVFLGFHLAHFTLGLVLPQYYANEIPGTVPDVFSMVKNSFGHPAVALFYVLALACIALHLSHGVWSATQSLGLNGRLWTPVAKKVGFAVGVGIAALFATIPLAGLFGLLKP